MDIKLSEEQLKILSTDIPDVKAWIEQVIANKVEQLENNVRFDMAREITHEEVMNQVDAKIELMDIKAEEIITNEQKTAE